MPNRIIKESICRSDTINSLKPFEEVLFYRLIVVCDDYGRFDGRPEIIKGACFPLKDTAVKDIGSALERLVEVGLVELYKVHEKPVLQLSSWSVHQQIRAKKSKYPSPDETCNHLISNDIKYNQQLSPDCNSSRNRESEYENRESKYVTGARVRENVPTRRFEEFWEAYPNKQHRHMAETAYCSLVMSGSVTEDELVTAAKKYASHIRENGGRMFMPNNFLEKCVFADYLEVENAKLHIAELDSKKEDEDLVEDEEWWKYGPNALEE